MHGNFACGNSFSCHCTVTHRGVYIVYVSG